MERFEMGSEYFEIGRWLILNLGPDLFPEAWGLV